MLLPSLVKMVPLRGQFLPTTLPCLQCGTTIFVLHSTFYFLLTSSPQYVGTNVELIARRGTGCLERLTKQETADAGALMRLIPVEYRELAESGSDYPHGRVFLAAKEYLSAIPHTASLLVRVWSSLISETKSQSWRKES